MDAPVHLRRHPHRTHRHAGHERARGILEAFYLGAVLLAPTIAIAGLVLLALGRPTAGVVFLAGGIVYRAVASAVVRLWDRLAASPAGLARQ